MESYSVELAEDYPMRSFIFAYAVSSSIVYGQTKYSWDLSDDSSDLNILKTLQPYSFLATDDSFRDFALYSESIELKIIDSKENDSYPKLFRFNPNINCSVGGKKVKKISSVLEVDQVKFSSKNDFTVENSDYHSYRLIVRFYELDSVYRGNLICDVERLFSLVAK